MIMITPEIIGKNLAVARNQFGYTQKDLADKLAISPQNVSKWERGISVPDVITLLQISEVLNKNITDFLISQHEPPKHSVPEQSEPVAVKYVNSVFSNTGWYKQRLCEIKREGIYLTNSVMRHTEFSSSELIRCKIGDCEFVNFNSVDSKISETDVYHSIFRFIRMKNTAVSSCKINATFHGCKISDSVFSGIVFDSSALEVTFENCTFRRVALKNCKRMNRCSLINCATDNMSEQAFRVGGASLINCSIMEE